MSDHDHGHHHHDHSADTHPHELEPPHEVFHDPQAGEVLRAWITEGNLSLATHAMAFGTAEVWGHVLAGIAHYIAGACAEQGMGTKASNFEDIRKALTSDMAKVTALLSANRAS